MPVHPDHPGVDVRPYLGAPDATFCVRYTDADGSKPRRSFDELEDGWEEYALIELARSMLSTHRCLWHAHAEPRVAHVAIRDIDAPFVVGFRNDLIRSGVGTESIIKSMSMLQRVFRDTVELGEAQFNPFKAVKKPASEPSAEAIPLAPLQVELLAADLSARGYGMSGNNSSWSRSQPMRFCAIPRSS
jgi:hypothetical protein